MSSRRMLEPILDKGLQSPHFFNGRLLTAEVLEAERKANQKLHRRLGRAAGAGVVWGMGAAVLRDGSGGTEPAVAIGRGLAVSANGQTLALPLEVEVVIVAPAAETRPGAGRFGDCRVQSQGVVGTGSGAYILVATPASGYDGQAPQVGPAAGGQVTGCGSQYVVEGIQFQLVPIPLPGGPGNPLTLRSRLAHRCFGTEYLLQFPPDPYPGPDPYGEVDLLLGDKLTECDVPLALLYWAGGRIQFVDMWAVRRRVTAPVAVTPWDLVLGQRRVAEAEAMFLQFQDQIVAIWQELRGTPGAPAAVQAVSRFRYLPAGGLLPTGPGEFVADTFFSGLSVEMFELDVGFSRAMLHQSFYVEPIDLADPPEIALFTAPDLPYTLFLRRERQVPGDDVGLPEDEETEPAETPVKEGTILADVTVSAKMLSKDVIIDDTDIEVYGMDALGHKHNARRVAWRGYEEQIKKQKKGILAEGPARFRMDKLPPGPYTVVVQARGFKKASQLVEVADKRVVRIEFALVPVGKSGGRTVPPKETAPADWLGPGWFGKIGVVPDIKWGQPEIWEKWKWLPDPPPEQVEDWIQQVGDWVVKTHPDAPVDFGDVRVYVDPDHLPGQVADHPYAYMVFGQHGAYAPLILTAGDKTLGGSVPASRGQVAGIDEELHQNKLKPSGMGQVDLLAHAWKGLVADTLGVSQATAGAIIAEARGKVDQLQNGVAGFAGVDAALAAALAAVELGSAVDLANASAGFLVAELAKQEIGISEAFAGRLIDEARAAVPAKTWSLSAGDLGLKGEELSRLGELGVDSQGALARAEVDEVAAVLGVQVEAASDLLTRADSLRGTYAVDVKAAAPVSEVFGVNKESAAILADSGVGTVGALSKLAVGDLQSLGFTLDKATSLLDGAKSMLGQ